MRVLCLDSELDIETDDYAFGSPISLFGYDLVIWKPSQSLEKYNYSITLGRHTWVCPGYLKVNRQPWFGIHSAGAPNFWSS